MLSATTNYSALLESLSSNIKPYLGRTLVIKYGGNAMTDQGLKLGFAQDIATLKKLGVNPVVVHGGGPQINYWLERIGKQGHFIQGMRVTDAETMSMVEMVLSGQVGKEIASLINHAGGSAVSISGRDANLIRAKKLFLRDENCAPIDIGQVGEVESLDTSILEKLSAEGVIPVIAPIGISENGAAFNINADLVAGKIAEALKAERLMLLTNISGVLDKNNALIHEMNSEKIAALILDGTIYGGMLPKIQSALTAAQNGVGAVHILDGRELRILLRAFLPKANVGTLVTIQSKLQASNDSSN